MKGIENVFSAKKLIAVIYRNYIIVDGVRFFTEATNPFQIGIHVRPKGVLLPPHVHKLPHALKIESIQEILYIIKGKIKINLYDTDGKFIISKILETGDSVLLVDGGHGLEFLENSRIYEVKQGPYPGSLKAKKYI